MTSAGSSTFIWYRPSNKSLTCQQKLNEDVIEVEGIKIVRMGGPLSFLSVNKAIQELSDLFTGEITDFKVGWLID